MNRKLVKVREDIRKAEARLKEAQEYLKTLRARERQLEDAEIIARIRGMQTKGDDIMDVLRVVSDRRDNGIEPEKEEMTGGIENDL